jgi:hypothetical protein
MTLRIDISGALSTHEERAALVRAVVVAQPEDELDWVEWKIAGDLGKGPTQGTNARHVLGMANRLPDRAALHAGGFGYLIMGAQPGSAPGISRVDPAALGQGVQSWLGTEGPAWWPHYDEEQGAAVLVVTVAPPQPGQRIFTLGKNLTVTTPGGGSIRDTRQAPSLSGIPAGRRSRDRATSGRWRTATRPRPWSQPGQQNKTPGGHWKSSRNGRLHKSWNAVARDSWRSRTW